MRIRTLLVSAGIAALPLVGGGAAWASTTVSTPASGNVPMVVNAPAPASTGDVGTQVQQDVQQGLQQQVGPDVQTGGPDTEVASAGSESAS